MAIPDKSLRPSRPSPGLRQAPKGVGCARTSCRCLYSSLRTNASSSHHIVSMLLFLVVNQNTLSYIEGDPGKGGGEWGVMEFDSLPVVSLLVWRESGLTVQVAHMPLKVLASAAFGKK